MIPSSYYSKLSQIESNNNPNAQNPKSSARGKYQFISSTAEQYGITAQFGTPEYEAQEEEAIKRFSEDNFTQLKQALKRNPTEGELYLAHQQGAEGAKKLLSSANAPAVEVIGRDQVLNNGGTENMTAKEFSEKWISKFGSDEIKEQISTGFTRDQILAEIERRKQQGVNKEVKISTPENKFTRDQILSEIKRRQSEKEQPGYFRRMAAHALKRGGNVRQTYELAKREGMPAAAFVPYLGESAMLIGDVGFETVATISKVIAPKTTEFIGDVAGKTAMAVMNTPPARFISREYGSFKDQHPLLAENIEGGLAVSMYVAPMLKAAKTSKAAPAVKKSSDLASKADDAIKEAAESAPKRGALRINQNERAIRNILKRSNKSYDDLLDELRSSDILTISDVAGDEVQGLTRSLGKMEGAKNVIHGALTQRSDESITRINAILSERISNVDNYFANIDELGKARAAAARPLYKKAFAEAFDIQDERLAKFLADKRIKDAMETAKHSYGVRIEAASNSLETLDGVKKVLYDIEAKAKRAGESNLANAYKTLRKDLVDVLDDASPSYKTARKVYEAPSKLIEAQEMGRIFDRLQPEEIKKALSSFEPHEIEAYRIGVRQKLQEVVSKAPDGADPARRIFGNQLKRKQLEAVFETKEHFEEFSKKMGDEIQSFKTRNAILSGSRTDYNIASDIDFIDAAADASRRGIVTVATDKIITAVADSVRNMYRGISKKNAEEVARILVDRDKGIKALQELLEKQTDFQQRASVGQIIKNHGAISLFDE